MSIKLSFENNTLSTKMNGTYMDGNPLANVTITGINCHPKSISINCGGQKSSAGVQWHLQGGAVYITGLEEATKGGAWSNELTISLQP